MTHDPFDLVGQRQAQQSEGDAKRLALLKEAEDIRWLMDSEQGRRIVWRQLQSSRVFHSTFDINPLVMAHAEGLRSVGLYWMTRVNDLCPDKYKLMLIEANNG